MSTRAQMFLKHVANVIAERSRNVSTTMRQPELGIKL